MAKSEKEIIRAINVSGVVFLPGQEDELVEALQAEEEKDETEKFDHKEELKRLEKNGSIVGFADVAAEEIDDSDSDKRATRKKNPHLLADPAPLAKGGPAPPTMEDVQMQPDSNVVEEKLSGGKAAAPENTEKVAAATEEAREEREEAAVQQESEQVAAPGSEPGTKPKGKGKGKGKK